MNDGLTQARLQGALGHRLFQFYGQVGSTNDVAREWAAAGAPNGAVVVAEEQIAGRGRFARRWNAPPGTALLLSMIIRAEPIQANYLVRLPLAGALAVVEVLEALGAHDLGIKWPNDVLLSGRKVAGILAETEWQGEILAVGVLGIGINVRVDFTGSELEVSAISVEPTLGVPIDRATLLAAILQRIDFWLVRLSSPQLIDTWRSRLITIGQRITARFADDQRSPTPVGHEAITGVALGVDDLGALLVQSDDNRRHRLVAGEVTLHTS